MANEQQMPGKEKEVAEDIQQKEKLIEENMASESKGDSVKGDSAQSPDTGETVEQLKAALAELQKQVDEAKESALRQAAEVQNAKRRADRAIEQAHKFALEKFVKELIPVVDSLERSLEVEVSIDEAFVNALRGGVEMTLSQLVKALGQFKVESIDPEGQPFDPALHQAMSIMENEKVEPNTVVAVMQKGYTLNDRLVRPAMVIVSKARAGSAKIDEQA